MGKASRKKTQLQDTVPQNITVPTIQDIQVRPFSIKISYIFLLILACIIAYYNTIENEFVHDDKHEILTNPYVHSLNHISKAFTTSSWAWKYKDNKGKSNYYRPTQTLSYMFIYSVYGPNPKAFHLFKLITHSICTLLVFLVCLEMFKQNIDKSLFAGLLFALHPMHTEAVTWISGITDVNCTLFVLGSFFFFIKFIQLKQKYYFYFSGILFFFGLLSKETAVMVVPLFFIYEYIQKKKIPSLESSKKYIFYFLIIATYLILRIQAIGSFTPVEKYQHLTNFQVILNAFPLMVKYFGKLLAPIFFNAHYEFHPVLSAYNIITILSFFLLNSIILSMWFFRKKNTVYFFNLCWMIITLLPVMHCKKLGLNVFTERYLYLPSVGFCILTSEFFFWILNKKKHKVAIYSTCTILLLFYSVQTISRNVVWKSNFTLFSETVLVSPGDALVHTNLGLAYYKKGETDKATEEYKEAIRLFPGFVRAYNNLGVVYYDLGKIDKAIIKYKEALKLYPNEPDVHNNLGNAYIKQNKVNEAIEEYKMEIKLNPNYALAHYNLGIVYDDLGQIEKAIKEYKEAIRSNFRFADAHNALGVIYGRKGLYDNAIERFMVALQFKPNFTDIHYNLAGTYLQKGVKNKAMTELEEILRITPNDTMVRKLLNQLRLETSGQ